jgi:hypothetical protein
MYILGTTDEENESSMQEPEMDIQLGKKKQ